MKNIIAFGASNSRKSINQQLARWAAAQISKAQINLLDLNDFEMPIYSIDREQDSGMPDEAKAFKEAIKSADGIIISFAEHNGSYSAAFKNILDWISRIEKGTWSDKPMLLLSTSPGGRGGATVINAATSAFPHQGGQVAGSFSLPSFYDNFDGTLGIKDPDMRKTFDDQLELFISAVGSEE